MLFYMLHFMHHKKWIILFPVSESTPYYSLPISVYCRIFSIDLNRSNVYGRAGTGPVPIFAEHLPPEIDVYSVPPVESEVNYRAPLTRFSCLKHIAVLGGRLGCFVAKDIAGEGTKIVCCCTFIMWLKFQCRSAPCWQKEGPARLNAMYKGWACRDFEHQLLVLMAWGSWRWSIGNQALADWADARSI